MSNSSITTENINVVQGSFRRGYLSRVVDRIKAWHERRVATRQLNALSDRMLRDIGVERHKIDQAVNRSGLYTKLVTEKTSSIEVSGEIKRAA